MSEPFGIYIHIPFCRHKCFYCDFYSVTDESVMDREDEIENYVNALTCEIERRSDQVKSRVAASVFIGGGTPSLLEPESVKKIIATCDKNYRLADDVEITMEMNPESASPDKLKGFLAAGVNRVSIGVQSLDDKRLKFLERIHTADEARRSVENIFFAGFTDVSVDMMYGLPEQTLTGWLEQLEEVATWGVTGLSCYELTPEPNTPLGALVAKGSISLSTQNEIFFDETEKFLESKGYEHYEISSYALPGRESLHNTGYWEYRDYIGAGAGAHGKIGHTRWENVKSIDGYISHVKENGEAPYVTEKLTKEMITTERLMMGLRLKRGILFDETLMNNKVDRMITEKFLEINGNYLRATRRGWRTLDSVLVNL